MPRPTRAARRPRSVRRALVLAAVLRGRASRGPRRALPGRSDRAGRGHRRVRLGGPRGRLPAGNSRRATRAWKKRWRASGERATLAVDHLEKSRRHAELAVVQFREGKDPLTEVPELRVGPMRELLEAARESTTQPVLSRLSMSEEELVATDGEPLPVPWPAGVEEMPATRAVEAAPEPVPAGNTPEASDEPERRLDPPARDDRSPSIRRLAPESSAS